VLDLPHVVANAPTDTNVKYITGDMFESIPSANAVFLKVRPYNRQIVLSLTLSIVMIF